MRQLHPRQVCRDFDDDILGEEILPDRLVPVGGNG
jgi:hypothetical protein